MTYYIIKIVITTALVVLISEMSRRNSVLGAILASIPLVSVLAMIWVYGETRDAGQIVTLSRSIFWLVLPSLLLFLLLPVLLERGYNFYASLLASIGVTIVGYYATIAIFRQLGFRL